MQSLEHWKILAEDVSFLIAQRIDSNKGFKKNIYVAPSGSTPFEKMFRRLLITCLVNRDIDVTNSQGRHAILSYNVDLINHSKRNFVDNWGEYQVLGPDLVAKRDLSNLFGLLGTKDVYPVVNVEAGKYTKTLPNSEIMVTTSLMFREEYLFRNSDIYYINEEDWDHYKEHKMYDSNLSQSYKIVGE